MALTCSAVSAVVVGIIPLLHVLDLLTFPLLLVLVALAGAARGPGDAAGHAMLPLLVEHAHLPTERVTGLAGAVERTASLAGAAIAGGLVAWSAAPTRWSSTPPPSRSPAWSSRSRPGGSRRHPAACAEEAVAASYVGELRDGWSFMRRDPVLMGIGVMIAVTNLLDQAWSVVLVPVWARDSGYGVGAVGLLAATFGAAAVAGSVAAAAWANDCRGTGPTWWRSSWPGCRGS